MRRRTRSVRRGHTCFYRASDCYRDAQKQMEGDDPNHYRYVPPAAKSSTTPNCGQEILPLTATCPLALGFPRPHGVRRQIGGPRVPTYTNLLLGSGLILRL